MEDEAKPKERINSLEIRSRVLLLADGKSPVEHRDRILAFLDQLDDDAVCKECGEERAMVCDSCGYIAEGDKQHA